MQHDEVSDDSGPSSNPSHPRPAPTTQQTPAPLRDNPTTLARSTTTFSVTSDAQSIGSNFTLWSDTAFPSALNPYHSWSNWEPSNVSTSRGLGDASSLQELKRVYRQIIDLEKKVQAEDLSMDELEAYTANKAADKWATRIQLHKTLAEVNYHLLILVSRPQVPKSLQTIPLKYNIPTRLWNNAFQRFLHPLRIASSISPVAHEHLVSFLFYAYGFYTTLLEEEDLASFRNNWIEALGDLARYRMAVITSSLLLAATPSHNGGVQHLAIPKPDTPRSTHGGDPSASAHATAELEADDEKEIWRKVAQDWYARSLKDMPSVGRLHHHLGLLSRDVPGEELQATYHFIKGLHASHALNLTHESVLPLFSLAQQSVRFQPSAPAPAIFLLMQGMLITRAQLDDFHLTLARFFERLCLEPESVSESEWVMMAVLNIGAVLEYGRPEGVIRKLGGLGTVASVKPRSTEGIFNRNEQEGHSDAAQGGMDGVVVTNKEPSTQDNNEVRIDGEIQESGDAREDVAVPVEALFKNPTSTSDTTDIPNTLRLALQLMFDTLSYVLKAPNIPSKSPILPASLNPYITIILTFLTALLRHEPTAAIFERSVPWSQLADFLSRVYRQEKGSPKVSPTRINSSPLPEDWCLRGMEWVGRGVYERGFWRPLNSRGGVQSEMDVILQFQPSADVVDEIVEEGDSDAGSLPLSWNSERWSRLRWCADQLVRHVHGLDLVGEGGSRTLQASNVLQQKADAWRLERESEEEAERKRRDRVRSREMDDGTNIDEVLDDEEDDDDDDENDTPEVIALKARRRYVFSLQRSVSALPQVPGNRHPCHPHPDHPAIQAAPGYTILVCDTNVLLICLPIMESLIASERWTVVLPLAVVTELDRLSQNHNELSKAAHDALAYLTKAIKTQSTSLKIQTSRGNYLSNLSIRSEEISFGQYRSIDRDMDDLILRTAIRQADYFIDRSSILKGGGKPSTMTQQASKVVLLSFDRNLRSKARARKLDAADERDMANIFAAS